MPRSESAAWVCGCGRCVPNSVDACRCGSTRAHAPSPVSEPSADTARSTRPSGLMLLCLGLMLGAALALPAWWRTPSAPVAATGLATFPTATATEADVPPEEVEPPAREAVAPPPPAEAFNKDTIEDMVAR